MQKSLLFALLFLGATAAHAVEPKAQGFYFGGVAGVTNFDDDGIGKAYGADLKDNSASFGIFGGYKFLKFLSVEGRFTYLGKYDYLDDAATKIKVKPTALTANLVGIIPLGGSGVELFGQAGVGGVFINDNLPSVGLPSLDNEATGTVGAGIRVYATETVAISAHYDWYGWEQKFESQKYDVNVETVLFGLQWLF